MDDLMCWLGAGPEGITIRLYEPVAINDGTQWVKVPQQFAEEALRVWRTAVYAEEESRWCR